MRCFIINWTPLVIIIYDKHAFSFGWPNPNDKEPVGPDELSKPSCIRQNVALLSMLDGS